MATKPDWASAIVTGEIGKQFKKAPNNYETWEVIAAKLLRAERRRAVRIVEKATRYDVSCDCGDDMASLGVYDDGEFVKRADILAALRRA